jgi:hypothetical protein
MSSGRARGRTGDGSFMALGDGNHKLPVRADVRNAIGKQAGDEVSGHLEMRLE